MNNKILVTIEVPLLGSDFDILIPINKKIGTIKKYCVEAIDELSNYSLENKDTLNLYDKEDCAIIDLNAYVKNTNVKNGSRLILL